MGRWTRLLPYITAVGLTAAAVAPTWAQTSPGGQTYVVGNTGGTGIHFRSSPGGSSVGSWPDGTQMIASGETRQVDGRAWRNVRAPDGTTGWVASEFLVSGTAGSTAQTGSQASPNAFLVGKTEGQNAVLRDVPGGTQIGSYPEGTTMTLVTSETRSAGEHNWRNVRGPDNKTGWMAAVLLSGSGSSTTAAAPASTGSPSSGTSASATTTTVTSPGPYSITNDMRARALAARARAVPAGQQRAPAASPTPTRTTGR